MLAILLLAGLAQASSRPVVIDAGQYIVVYKASGSPININPTGVISFRGIVFNPSSSASPIIVATTGTLTTITINGKSADQLSIKKKRGATPTNKVVLESSGGFLKVYSDAEIVELRAAGNIASLTSKNAPVDDAIANGFGSIKLAGIATNPSSAMGMEIDTWRTSTVSPVKPPAGKITLTGIPLANAFLLRQNAAITIAAKKLKTGMVPASVLLGAEITGKAVAVSVRGGDLLAETIQAQRGISLLGSTKGKDGVGGTVGTTLSSAALSVYLTSASLAAVQHPGSLFASGLDGLNDAKTDAKEGIGNVFATTAVFGVFVAGGTQPEELLVMPNFSADVKKFKTPVGTGDTFVHFPAIGQPAGIVAHTSLP
jgi:hypothetical protein